MIKNILIIIIGVVGGIAAAYLGKYDDILVTLLIFMGIDYVTGFIVAGVFKKSDKSENGALESKAGWKGLSKKGVSLLMVLVGNRLDMLIESHTIQDAITVAFIANESISIIENVGLMGIPIPEIIKKSIDILNNKQNQ